MADDVLIEVGNDNGDHYVISIPKNELKRVTKALTKAGCSYEAMYNYRHQSAKTQQRYFKGRDHGAYTQYSDHIVDPDEDLEVNSDMEYDVYV